MWLQIISATMTIFEMDPRFFVEDELSLQLHLGKLEDRTNSLDQEDLRDYLDLGRMRHAAFYAGVDRFLAFQTPKEVMEALGSYQGRNYDTFGHYKIISKLKNTDFKVA